jgi:predicted membrane protein
MRKLHLIFGILLFVVFLTTGRFMRWDFPDKEIIPQELRILMRSRHIYILFSACIHILLGVYFKTQTQNWRKYLQTLASFLLIAASFVLVYGFIYETYQTQHFSDVSRNGIYLTLAGTILHVIANIASQNRKI